MTELPFLASSKRARGFADRRFIDRNVGVIQSEIRFPIVWRIGGVFFGSAGKVSPELSDILEVDTKYAGGFGLRFMLSKSELTRLRFDYGFSDEGSNIYVTINEAF